MADPSTMGGDNDVSMEPPRAATLEANIDTGSVPAGAPLFSFPVAGMISAASIPPLFPCGVTPSAQEDSPDVRRPSAAMIEAEMNQLLLNARRPSAIFTAQYLGAS